ncbi:MAG: DUF3303 family protein [Bacteroidota bacterium]
MLYMVYEKFKTVGAKAVYQRSKERGRMLPEGLNYVSSWVDLEFTKCFQLIETEDYALFSKWTDQWKDIVGFEIIPVRTSAEAMAVIAPTL